MANNIVVNETYKDKVDGKRVKVRGFTYRNGDAAFQDVICSPLIACNKFSKDDLFYFERDKFINTFTEITKEDILFPDNKYSNSFKDWIFLGNDGTNDYYIGECKKVAKHLSEKYVTCIVNGSNEDTNCTEILWNRVISIYKDLNKRVYLKPYENLARFCIPYIEKERGITTKSKKETTNV